MIIKCDTDLKSRDFFLCNSDLNLKKRLIIRHLIGAQKKHSKFFEK